MKVTGIYVYPVKGLRGIALPAAELSAQGVKYDRNFMLLTTKRSKSGKLQKMQLSSFPECALFSQEMAPPSEADAAGGAEKNGSAKGRARTKADRYGDAVIVHYHPPPPSISPPVDRAGAEKNRIIMSPVQHPPLRIPLEPSLSSLSPLNVDLHGSHAQGYRMGDNYDAWFSACFGFDVVLVYIGDGQRPVLGETLRKGVTVKRTKSAQAPSLMASILSFLIGVWTALLTAIGLKKPPEETPWLTFTDCAPLLVTAESSLRNVKARMAENDVPMYKFRPNIVVDGEGEEEWAEDYWGELTFRPPSGGRTSAAVSDVPSLTSRGSSPSPSEDGIRTPSGPDSVRLLLTSNCARCTSLNVDYKTGARASGEMGELLGRLCKDRRVDPGTKYSPVFGRYAFLDQRGSDGGYDEDEEEVVKIAVGDEVAVTRRNTERTIWDWPDL